MDKNKIAEHRDFLKDSLRQTINFRFTDQHQGVEPPPVEKPPRPEQVSIPLPNHEKWNPFHGTDLLDAISNRKSQRRFSSAPLTLAELAFLLWSTQGIKKELAPGTALRTVPSAGCRHPFETYLLVANVEGLDVGVYRYLPLEHALVMEKRDEDLVEKLAPATLGQAFTAAAPVIFVWAAIPYRTEWRYTTAAHRVILLDAGHICQNLYLACEAIHCGTCAIAAFNQDLMDQLLGVDGVDEFTVYMAPVGKR
ncbi:SagB-type dehydrogenase domain-containing protein [Desulfuromusa kysingii]|uniref:SagB-type dehydrogenase domain-containing protein n=1 Tax=Desulfuromusa kysingii TaxID=37625 RepID=A0A1H4C8W8_9BACT|nr:SagB/ThcOx family dehydrogenase [Desulfuromusa kysingii]SEA56798.1 SagB-type dehydrogenase domain-containing protein [Desulfuromusa kysingii]